MSSSAVMIARGLSIAIAGVALAGCETYPPAEEVVACAAARFESKQGTFSVLKASSSRFSSAEYTILYQKNGSPDRAAMIYRQGHGLVTTQVEISYGNHAEIASAVDAIRSCALPR